MAKRKDRMEVIDPLKKRKKYKKVKKETDGKKSPDSV
jgi:hypothetical protein